MTAVCPLDPEIGEYIQAGSGGGRGITQCELLVVQGTTQVLSLPERHDPSPMLVFYYPTLS